MLKIISALNEHRSHNLVDTHHAPQLLKCLLHQTLGEDVSNVISRGHIGEIQVTPGLPIQDKLVGDINVLALPDRARRVHMLNSSLVISKHLQLLGRCLNLSKQLP